MTYEVIFHFIQQYGYVALFLSIALGVFLTPVPDEVLVMTGGLITALGLLEPVPAFIITYLGLITGLSLCYIIGKQFGVLMFSRLLQNRSCVVNLSKAKGMLARFDHYALLICYYMPFVRHLVPFLVGVNKMPYYKYAVYSYSSGLLWTLLYFGAGIFFGNNIDLIAYQVRLYGTCLLIIIILGFIVWYIYQAKNRFNQ